MGPLKDFICYINSHIAIPSVVKGVTLNILSREREPQSETMHFVRKDAPSAYVFGIHS